MNQHQPKGAAMAKHEHTDEMTIDEALRHFDITEVPGLDGCGCTRCRARRLILATVERKIKPPKIEGSYRNIDIDILRCASDHFASTRGHLSDSGRGVLGQFVKWLSIMQELGPTAELPKPAPGMAHNPPNLPHTCYHCAHCLGSFVSCGGGELESHCHAHPPSIEGNFPKVSMTDFCGEWKELNK